MQTLQSGRFYPMWLAGLLLALMVSAAQAADFKVTDTNGKPHSLSGYKGKWVLVNYWATWCPPCLEEIPDLIALHENKKNNLVVIGVAMDYRNAKQVTDFAEGLLVEYPIVLGTPEIVSQIGPVQGLPTTYLFNPEGKMVAQQVGLITRASVESYIASKPARPKK
ncbi:MAG TPA: TlpA disulfide reductase family protein [Thiobacillus sp.]|jgi:thiol-disulfide isomerase/thioredoxin|nr:TlpA family protein disulfide reductase [Gammaproteobacteria bacterium]OYZ30344.1 MAG: thioredoxin [Hydrogenophilales bacterium 16-64-40]OZA34175.1 MAG: thioredoxin [Hydrogenophilales bacterium 17-64-65]HQS82239.1 TlpA disulfide reductase family protein [Thiobacillus sp.]HQT34695.1 TlpA disulfide reductase family protein [Thiobacillus sp.]